MSRDRPIEIVKLNSYTKKYDLNLSSLENELKRADVKDCDLAVVSICGAFRKGKSLMMSFFLDFLNDAYKNKNFNNWLSRGNNRLKNGFEWKSGSTRHTTGISVWPHIFTTRLLTGQKIGILLMDTQGTFDPNTTQHDNVMIFSLTTMLSSVQIYNLMNNIQENDLQNLQLYTEYGKLATKNDSTVKPFQSLIFLVRDWSYPFEADYGFEGGQNILDEYLKITHDQHPELRNVRKHIRSCYDELSCCLLPFPGKKVQKDPNFDGKLSDIDEDFLTTLKVFVPTILCPENVKTKKINGTPMKAKNFIDYIKMCWETFNQASIPTAKSIYNITIEYNTLLAQNECMEYYSNKMSSYLNSKPKAIPNEELNNIHIKYQNGSMLIFKNKTQFGSDTVKAPYLNKLTKYFSDQFIKFMGANEAKRTENLKKSITALTRKSREVQEINRRQQSDIKDTRNRFQAMQISAEKGKRKNKQKIRKLLRDLDVDTSSDDDDDFFYFFYSEVFDTSSSSDDDSYLRRCPYCGQNNCRILNRMNEI